MTVSYRSVKTWIFDRSTSVGDDSDTFTTINPVVFGLGWYLQYSNLPVKTLVEAFHILSEAEPLVTVTVADMLWGYDDAYLVQLEELLGPDTLPFTKFGFWYGSNNTAGEIYTLFTGESDITKRAHINVYAGKEQEQMWTTEYANMINGTDGGIYAPLLQENEDVYIYSADICRSLAITYDGMTKLHGIPVGIYHAPIDWLANPFTENMPENEGFCIPDTYSCTPTGMVNSSQCYGGVPVYISHPHFLYGREELLNTIEGLSPNQDEHEIYFEIDMLVGVPFKARSRIQVNLGIQQYDFLPNTLGVPEVYMPVLWYNESFTLDEPTADFYKDSVQKYLYLLYSITYILFGIGGGLFFGAIISIECLLMKKKKAKKMVQEMKEKA